jgi:hypothetical protein
MPRVGLFTVPACRAMVHRALILASAALTLALALPSTSNAARLSEKHICNVYRCTTMTASRQVRVFQGVTRRRYAESYADYAEWLPTRRVTRLGYVITAPEQRIFDPALKIAGNYLAYLVAGENTKYCDSGCGKASRIVRLDVEDGQQTTPSEFRAETDGTDCSECIGLDGRGVEFALTPRGTAAWAFDTGIEWVGRDFLYVLRGGSDTTTLVAHAPTLEPASLALIPGHLYWLEGGAPRTLAVP